MERIWVVLAAIFVGVFATQSASASEVSDINGYDQFILGAPIESFELSTYQGPMTIKSPDGEEIVTAYYLPSQRLELFGLKQDVNYLIALGFLDNKLESIALIFFNFYEDFDGVPEILEFLRSSRYVLREKFLDLVPAGDRYDILVDDMGRAFLSNELTFRDLDGDEVSFWGLISWSYEEDGSQKLQSFLQTLTISSNKYLEVKEKNQ